MCNIRSGNSGRSYLKFCGRYSIKCGYRMEKHAVPTVMMPLETEAARPSTRQQGNW